MMTTSAYTSLVGLLVVAVMQVAAVGPCNNALIQELMTANAANCPKDLLQQMYRVGPQMTFRVISQTLSSLLSCVTAVLTKPVNNVAMYYVKSTYHNQSIGDAYVNFTMVEANCGFFYKYIVEEAYVGFKIVYSYYDGISFGYYGCTDEETPFSEENGMYAQCHAPSIDSPEVEASLLKCKAHMEQVTGVTGLALLPACDNNNEYLDLEEVNVCGED